MQNEYLKLFPHQTPINTAKFIPEMTLEQSMHSQPNEVLPERVSPVLNPFQLRNANGAYVTL